MASGGERRSGADDSLRSSQSRNSEVCESKKTVDLSTFCFVNLFARAPMQASLLSDNNKVSELSFRDFALNFVGMTRLATPQTKVCSA